MIFVVIVYLFALVGLVIAGASTLVGHVPAIVVVGLLLFLLFAALPVWEYVHRD